MSFILCFSEWAYTKEEGVLSCVGSFGLVCLFVLAVFWGCFGAVFFAICTELQAYKGIFIMVFFFYLMCLSSSANGFLYVLTQMMNTVMC